MKKLIAVVMVSMTAAAGVAFARQQKRISNAEVERAIDARLHLMVVQMNQSKR